MIPLCLTLLLALPQAEDSQLATYDLRRVMPRWDEGNALNQSLLCVPLTGQDEGETIRSEHYAGLQAFELLDLLNQILGDELRREGREMLVEGASLTVLAPAPLQQQVRAILDGLEQALAATITLRVDVFRLAESAAEPSGVLLGEDEAQRYVSALGASGAEAQTFQLQLSTGRTALVDAQREVPFLFDQDVEIAQGVSVFVPVMRSTRAGTRLALRASGTPGGTQLSLLMLAGDLRRLDAHPLEIQSLVTITDKPPFQVRGPELVQSPDLDLTSFACDAFLPDGKVLALTFESNLAGQKGREVVLVRRTAGALGSFVQRPIPGSNRSLIALDTQLFRPTRSDVHVEQEESEASAGLLVPRVDAELNFEASGFLVEWLRARFTVWRPFGPWILIVTDPAWDRDAAAQLERLVKSVRPRTTMGDATFELRQGGTRLVRARVPLLEGSRAGFVVGHGRTALTGYQAEVAQSAAVHDPMVATIFDGLAWACLWNGDGGELEGLAQITASRESIKPHVLLGPVELVEAQVLEFDERFRLDGKPQRFGAAGERLALELNIVPLNR